MITINGLQLAAVKSGTGACYRCFLIFRVELRLQEM